MGMHIFVCEIEKEMESQLREDVRLSVTFEYARRTDGKKVQLSLRGLGKNVFDKMEQLIMNNARAMPGEGGTLLYRVKIVEVNV
jgi:hypothetical protein